MSHEQRDPLDAALSKLPRSVTPQRDLWPSIRAQLEAEPQQQAPARRGFAPRWYQLAAGVLLVVASSLTTFVLMREAPQSVPATTVQTEPLRPEVIAMPASFGRYQLGEDYSKAREQLDLAFEQRLALLPPAAREKVERNLADIRSAAREIADTLAQHPTDPLLQELLMSTYQSELQLLADVTQMAPAPAPRVQL
jgi:hypothetical protein